MKAKKITVTAEELTAIKMGVDTLSAMDGLDEGFSNEVAWVR